MTKEHVNAIKIAIVTDLLSCETSPRHVVKRYCKQASAYDELHSLGVLLSSWMEREGIRCEWSVCYATAYEDIEGDFSILTIEASI